nr:NAD-dependent protein deacetylase sirtuin-7 [Vanessa tameamea]
MAAREGVRSSARLSGATTTTAAANAAATNTGQDSRAAEAERAAAAALRKARAARAAERAAEVEDSPQVLREKCRRLARALREAKHLVVYTGAGISTAADIPDYRGPRGVWTRLQRGETVGRVEVSRARPTFTHMALTALWARGALKFVVSQNCDGLHVRAGLPRRALAELHGDMFAERCPACRRVYLRAFDTTERTARHAHATRRLCHACGRELRDSIVHFGERGRSAWPLNWAGALRHAAAADVVLCLGSSLKVLRRYPRLWRMQSAPHARPALYIVNLQWTPKDAVAALKINARCDAVMEQVARRLRLRVPRYRARRDPLLAHAEPLAPPETHTTRRPLLSRPASDDTSYYSLSASSSPSASDSDDEVPLRRLADRLRDPQPPPAPTLRSFQVNMQSGETTILLRAEHAPTDPPPPEPPPAARATTDALRRFRISRPHGPLTIVNGIGPTTNGHRLPGCDLNGLETKIESPPPAKIKKEEADDTNLGNGSWNLGCKLRQLLELQPRIDGDGPKYDIEAKAKTEAESDDEEANATLAAAIIRRAVLVCRAQLYSGLHTIIAPGAPPGAPAASAAPAPAPRPAGPQRGRRYLCACCGEDGEAPAARAPGDEGGWYGKGYRKGRRRRR